jgi:hypothetical protein
MKIIRIALGVVIVVFAYLIFKGINEPIQFNKEKKYRYSFVIQKLKDLRTAQSAYKSVKGHYTNNYDSLLTFVKQDSFILVKQIGNPDDTTAVIVRDTSYLSVKDSLYVDGYIVDSLPYVPFTNGANKFKMEAGEIEKGKVKVKVFEITDTKPFDENQILKVGSMTEPSNAGNWE